MNEHGTTYVDIVFTFIEPSKADITKRVIGSPQIIHMLMKHATTSGFFTVWNEEGTDSFNKNEVHGISIKTV